MCEHRVIKIITKSRHKTPPSCFFLPLNFFFSQVALHPCASFPSFSFLLLLFLLLLLLPLQPSFSSSSHDHPFHSLLFFLIPFPPLFLTHSSSSSSPLASFLLDSSSLRIIIIHDHPRPPHLISYPRSVIILPKNITHQPTQGHPRFYQTIL